MTAKSKGFRLFIFIDKDNDLAEFPIMIILNRMKTIETLMEEMESRMNIPKSHQHWIFNKQYCYSHYILEDIMDDGFEFNQGFCGVLFTIDEKDKDDLSTLIEIYLEQKYGDMDLTERWKKPIDSPIIITEKIDMNKIASMGWNCSQCTFLNKPYFRCCSACGYSRPKDYEIPSDFYYTPDDIKFIEDEKKREEEQKKKEKLERERQEKEKKENLVKLKKMYKDEDVSYSTEKTECPICCMEFEPGEAIILKACFHTVCKECFTDFLRNALDPKVKCLIPDCQGIIEDREIKGVLSEEDYEKYQKLNLRTAEGKLGLAAFHCKTPNCEAFVLFDDNVNFFPCPLCEKENCILCRAIHTGQNCKEYQDELAIKAKNDEAARKDQEFLENMIKNGEAMRCPGCKIIVQKKSGCDWMMCNMCKMELCWATKGPRWGPKGKGDTTGGCKCRVNGKSCTPTCGNCH